MKRGSRDWNLCPENMKKYPVPVLLTGIELAMLVGIVQHAGYNTPANEDLRLHILGKLEVAIADWVRCSPLC